MVLTIRDDGRGFAPGVAKAMEARADSASRAWLERASLLGRSLRGAFHPRPWYRRDGVFPSVRYKRWLTRFEF